MKLINIESDATSNRIYASKEYICEALNEYETIYNIVFSTKNSSSYIAVFVCKHVGIYRSVDNDRNEGGKRIKKSSQSFVMANKTEMGDWYIEEFGSEHNDPIPKPRGVCAKYRAQPSKLEPRSRHDKVIEILSSFDEYPRANCLFDSIDCPQIVVDVYNRAVTVYSETAGIMLFLPLRSDPPEIFKPIMLYLSQISMKHWYLVAFQKKN